MSSPSPLPQPCLPRLYFPCHLMYYSTAMKKTLHLYILKEITPPFLLGIITFTSVLLMGRLLRLADMVVANGVPLVDVLLLVLYLLPFFCLVTIPMAFLLAVLLSFGRLSADSEIIAIKAGGISLYSLMPPVLAFALLAYAATTFITVKALPWGNVAFKQQIQHVARSRADIALKERVFIDDFPGMTLYIDRYDEKQRVMSGILIHDDRNPAEPSTIFAAKGAIASDNDGEVLHLHLYNGNIHRSLGKTGYRLIQFTEYALAVTPEQQKIKTSKDEQEMTFVELRSAMGNPTADSRLVRRMRLEFHRRFALPFACIVFALTGVPLGIQNQRSGKAAGFSLSIGVILVYYILFTAGKTLGERGVIDPIIAVWSPNLLFTLFGIMLLRTTAAERRLKIFEYPAILVKRLRKLFQAGGTEP